MLTPPLPNEATSPHAGIYEMRRSYRGCCVLAVTRAPWASRATAGPARLMFIRATESSQHGLWRWARLSRKLGASQLTNWIYVETGGRDYPFQPLPRYCKSAPAHGRPVGGFIGWIIIVAWPRRRKFKRVLTYLSWIWIYLAPVRALSLIHFSQRRFTADREHRSSSECRRFVCTRDRAG